MSSHFLPQGDTQMDLLACGSTCSNSQPAPWTVFLLHHRETETNILTIFPPCYSGSMNQFTAIYNRNGELINNIKYYDGFMGQRVGAISCLAFHPHWVCTFTPGFLGRGQGGKEGSKPGSLDSSFLTLKL